MTTPVKKTILDYFSQKSEGEKSINQDEKQETPKKLKTARTLVEDSDSSSFVDNFTDSEVFKETVNFSENNDNIPENTVNSVGNSSFIGKFENTFNLIENSKQPKISKIMADYLDADIKEFNDEADKKANQEERYEFLINVKDKNGKSKGEDGYDPSKLYIPKKCYEKFTSFEKQFWDIKSEHFDTVIFFKKGKFYELYEDDAGLASKLFDLRIADRVNMKMAGVPESSYDTWAAKFVEKGFKIGRVDQSENAIGKKLREQDAKKDKIINRELKEIITPGTIYNNEFLGSCFPVYLGVLIQHNKCYNKECLGPCHFSVLLYDSSTNQIFIRTFCDSYDCNILKGIFIQNEIKELITDEKINLKSGIIVLNPIKTAIVSPKKLDFSNNEEFECFSYLHNYMKLLCRESSLEHATISNIKETGDFMDLDGSTIANLDILVNNFNFKDDFTLFKTINYCHTSFGQRLLRRWIVAPLKNLDLIVEKRKLALIFEQNEITEIINELKLLADVERLMGKLANGIPTFKDISMFVINIRKVKSIFNKLIRLFSDKDEKYCKFTESHFKIIDDMLNSFESTYCLTDNEISPGSENDELFGLHRSSNKIKEELDSFLSHMKTFVGSQNLSYKNIGKEIFQIEAPLNVTFPPNFYLVSSTKNCKRYYSKDLKEIIERFVETDERIFQSKGSILKKVADFLNKYSHPLTQAISFLASIDCLISFSIFNSSLKTSVPEFSGELEIINFTNPVYPQYIRNSFKPNSTISLVTGPNMGGKSTFLRSICLNIILAQMGMNVCCEKMRLPLFDKIFTRIGASDSLARGESTFMVEMNEASKILNQSTKFSFVIMDELGRGTSTKDGEAIALAVLDSLKDIGCYTLFSTHYHRICEQCNEFDKLHVKCKVEAEDITFLYKVEKGTCNDSHGLYVAKLAGIPDFIIDEAFKIKKNLLN